MEPQWSIGDPFVDSFRVFDFRSGGHGTVYFLEDPATHMKLAAKVYSNERGRTQQGLEAFREECRLWLELPRHINWLECIGVQLVRGHITLFTEYVDGRSLRELLESDAISIGSFLDIMIQTLTGLQALQQHGLVHGDVKPENILVDSFGLVKIIDLSATYNASAEKQPEGTYPYNMLRYSRHSPDIFACLLILVEALLGIKESLGSVFTHLSRQSGYLPLNWDEVASHTISDTYLPDAANESINNLIKTLLDTAREYSTPKNGDLYSWFIEQLKIIYDQVHPLESDAWLEINEALAKARTGNVTGARRDLEDLVKHYEQDASAWAQLGTICLLQEDIDRARESALKSLRLNRRNDPAWLLLGGCYYHLQQYDQEHIAYRKGLEINPRVFDLWDNLSRSCVRIGAEKDSLRCIGRAMMLEPDHPTAILWLEQLEQAGEEYQKSLDFLNLHRGSIARPKKSLELSNLGLYLHLSDAHEAAIAKLNEAIKLDSNVFQAWHHKALALTALGRLEEARHCHEQALALNHSVPELWSGYANVLRLLGDTVAAKRAIETAWGVGVRSNELLHVLALTYEAEGNYREMLRWLEKAEAGDPQNYEIHRNKGTALNFLGQYKEALASYSTAITLKPNDVDSLQRRGEVNLKLQRYGAANKDFRAVLELEPNHSRALHGLALAIIDDGGDLAEALELLDSALEQEPNDPILLENRRICMVQLMKTKSPE